LKVVSCGCESRHYEISFFRHALALVPLLDLDGRLSVNGNHHVDVAAVFVVTLDASSNFTAPDISEFGVVVLMRAPGTTHFALEPSGGFVVFLVDLACGLVPFGFRHLVPFLLFFIFHKRGNDLPHEFGTGEYPGTLLRFVQLLGQLLGDSSLNEY
jgi:hypothetical protein